jgi:hypothetical protein
MSCAILSVKGPGRRPAAISTQKVKVRPKDLPDALRQAECAVTGQPAGDAPWRTLIDAGGQMNEAEIAAFFARLAVAA